MVASKSSIFRASQRLSHAESSRLADLALASGAQAVILDLSHVQDATTAAFARLVLLRREMLLAGRDIRLAGLRGRPSQLFEVHRLQTVLPRISELPTGQTSQPEPARLRACKTQSHAAPTPASASFCLLQ